MYLYYAALSAFFPVAVFEEAFGRGYLPDRLLPPHPSRIATATPAFLVSSVLMTLDPLPGYLGVYSFSPTRAALLLASTSSHCRSYSGSSTCGHASETLLALS